MDKILIVDSNHASARLIQKYLAKSGCDAMVAHNADGVATRVAVTQPDLIIMSDELERESGFDACKRLKNSVNTDYIPVLMLIAPDSLDGATRSAWAGADDHIYASGDASALISKVNSLLRIKRLSDQLKSQYVELEDKNKLLDSQLKTAMRVQRSIIQEYDFNHGGAEFYSRYIPALDIGGDYYDIIPLDKDTVCVFVGDVSGHGISAALLVAMLHTMVHNLVGNSFNMEGNLPSWSLPEQQAKSINPSVILSELNREFFKVFEKRDSEIYVCMFCAVINTRLGNIRFGNAGHVLPVHVRRRYHSAAELTSVGTPIGMLEDSVYENFSISFDPGDIFVFYTDGLSDNCFKGDSDEFVKHLKSTLLASQSLSPEQLADTVIELSGADYLRESRKYQMDDMSLIICKTG